jgi:hypothetical protein
MVISHILGGLGNQLFQYATGRAIAEKNKVPFKLDLTDFRKYKLRNFDLDKFNLPVELASATEIGELKPGSPISRALQYLKPVAQRTWHRESVLHYNKSIEKLGANVYLKGYFQSEKYFSNIAGQLKAELTIQPQYIASVTTLGARLKNENSISVHIRRGDYTSAAAADVHPLLTQTYYLKAIELIARKIPSPVFYVFSDDQEWTRQHLPVNNAVYVSGVLSRTHLEDFYLMSQCRHNIIANSSFSWWSAWLNDNPSKTVIAPKEWFTKGWQEIDDRIPNSWLKM